MKRESSTSPKTILINKTQTSLESHQRIKTSTQAAKMGYKTRKNPNMDPKRRKTRSLMRPGDLEVYQVGLENRKKNMKPSAKKPRSHLHHKYSIAYKASLDLADARSGSCLENSALCSRLDP
jgi:hypothetical protein